MGTRSLFCIFIILIACQTSISQQAIFRKGIFLHHSTGACIWGQNGCNTSMPDEMNLYNQQNNYSGSDSVWMEENWYPSDDNEWATWHKIFDNQDSENNIESFLQSYQIIMIKSCFPSSGIYGEGEPTDTIDYNSKTLYNYKWHWRSIVNKMKTLKNFFVIWTNAPLVSGATSREEAALSDWFCTWAKDTLAKGLDPDFGDFPKNIYVFDFFHLLADESGFLPSKYASGSDDSHPNAEATALVVPILCNQVFNAAINYEQSITAVQENEINKLPAQFSLSQNYPNPFNPTTKIEYQLGKPGLVKLKIYDVHGNEIAVLANEEKPAGKYYLNFSASGLASGVYYFRLESGEFSQTRKLILIR